MSPACGVRADVKVTEEPLKLYSVPATRTPLRNRRRLPAGFGADASVNVTFVALIVPPGISASVKFVGDPVPAMR